LHSQTVAYAPLQQSLSPVAQTSSYAIDSREYLFEFLGLVLDSA